MIHEKVGIIDIGSNTIRLVVYDIDCEHNYIEIQNIKTPARLSQYLETQGDKVVLSQKGIQILVETLVSFKKVWQSAKGHTLKVMATAAIRQSANQTEILKTVKDQTDLEISVVTEQEEASYGQYAILHSLSISDAITVDLGGGSCEITCIQNKQMAHYHSFPFGAVSLKKQFFANKNHNDPDAIEDLIKYIRKQFKNLEWLKKSKLPIIAVGGSARNIALVHQFLISYPLAGIHGYQMNAEDIKKCLDLFKQTAYSDMGNIDGLSNDRHDIIIPAAIVFTELLAAVKSSHFTFSSQGLREGIILKYINTNYNEPINPHLIQARSIRKIQLEFPRGNFKGVDLRAKYTIDLYKQLCELGHFDYDFQEQELLEYAAYLHLFGTFISPDADSQHTFYLLSNMNILGFSHKERVRLALLASYRNRSLFNQYVVPFTKWFSKEELDKLQKLAGIIKFAQALNDSQTGPISHIYLSQKVEKTTLLEIHHTQPIVAEQYRIDRHAKHLIRALDNQKLMIHYVANY